MPSVTEITYFKASEARKSGSVNFDEALALLRSSPGHLRSYFGNGIETPDVIFWVNVWESKEALDGFLDGPVHARVVELSRPAFGSEPTVNRVAFDDTQRPLGAPITELVTFALKEGESIAELGRLLRVLHEALPGTPRLHGDSWGQVIDKPNVYHSILGWDTVEAHRKAVATGPLRKMIDEALVIADLWQAHAALKLVESEGSK